MKLLKPALILALAIIIGIIVGQYIIRPTTESLGKKSPSLAAGKIQIPQEKVEGAAPSSKKNSTTSLPSKTNNAWEMNEIRFPDTQGTEHSLEDWKGNVIMLNFWGSWCAPCQYEIPRFVTYQEKYAEKGFQIVGLGLDQSNKLANVERSLEMNYPTLVVPENQQKQLMQKWGNSQSFVPYTVVIGRDGTLEYIHRGLMDDNAFDRYVLPLIAAQSDISG